MGKSKPEVIERKYNLIDEIDEIFPSKIKEKDAIFNGIKKREIDSYQINKGVWTVKALNSFLKRLKK